MREPTTGESTTGPATPREGSRDLTPLGRSLRVGASTARVAPDGTSLRSAYPAAVNSTPIPAANAATPNAMTDVNSDERRNEAFIIVARTRSSLSSSAYVLPSEAWRACLLMMSGLPR